MIVYVGLPISRCVCLSGSQSICLAVGLPVFWQYAQMLIVVNMVCSVFVYSFIVRAFVVHENGGPELFRKLRGAARIQCLKYSPKSEFVWPSSVMAKQIKRRSSIWGGAKTDFCFTYLVAFSMKGVGSRVGWGWGGTTNF